MSFGKRRCAGNKVLCISIIKRTKSYLRRKGLISHWIGSKISKWRSFMPWIQRNLLAQRLILVLMAFSGLFKPPNSERLHLVQPQPWGVSAHNPPASRAKTDLKIWSMRTESCSSNLEPTTWQNRTLITKNLWNLILSSICSPRILRIERIK